MDFTLLVKANSDTVHYGPNQRHRLPLLWAFNHLSLNRLVILSKILKKIK
jgi:hypothetical protein